jgi:hypothetical protein
MLFLLQAFFSGGIINGKRGYHHRNLQHGFVAVDQNEVQRILADAYNKLSVNEIIPVERIFSKYYSDHPGGTEFPMILWASLPGMKEVLRGSDWNGSLDLHNPEQFRNFGNYVFRP